MSTISAGTTSTTTLVHSGDTTGSLVFKTNDTGSGGTTAVTIDTSQNATFAGKVTSAGALTLASNGTTTAVTIDTSQNVGIGTTSPSSFYSEARNLVVGTGTGGQGISIYAGSASQSRLMFANGTAGSQAYNGFVQYDHSSNTLQFGTNGGTERMRIDSSGYVGIGTSSPSSYGALAVRKGVSGTWLGVVSNCSFETSDAANSSIYMMHSSANSGSAFICSDAGGRLQMFCSSSATGGVYLGNGATSWASASDERVKENLVPIENGLTKVASLRTFTGNYINDPDKKSRAFLIAQDVEAVLPEAVDHSNPDELGLSYTDVIPLLVASIKELKAINDQQAETINALTARVVALEKK